MGQTRYAIRQQVFIIGALALAFFLTACSDNGTKELPNGDIDLGDTWWPGGDWGPDDDAEPDEGLGNLLLNFNSRFPGLRNDQAVVRLDGAFSRRFNVNGSDVLDQQAVGAIETAALAELKDYLAQRTPEVAQNAYMELGENCIEGDLLYNGAKEYALQWHCSDDPTLLNFLSFVNIWLDANCANIAPDGDAENVETDGDLDEAADGDEDLDVWEGICEGPPEYEESGPLLDYRYVVEGTVEDRWTIDENGEFFLVHRPAVGMLRNVEGALDEAELTSLAVFVQARAPQLGCFEGQWCEAGPYGHFFWFGRPVGEQEPASALVDYRCPENEKLLEIIDHLNVKIAALLEPADGDEEQEAEEIEEEAEPEEEPEPEGPPDCDDGNVCTDDAWDEELGACRRAPVPDGAPCDDGKAGTFDQCVDGVCVGSNVACPDWPTNERGFCETNLMGNAGDPSPMVFVPANSFQQGFSGEECGEPLCVDGRPAHTTTLLQGYWVDKVEVTQSAYFAFAAAVPQWQVAQTNVCGPAYADFSGEPDDPLWPAAGLCWHAAQAFCRWTGKRLPTEAEWEYAARGPNSNPDGRRYPWGDGPADCDRANFGDENGDGQADDPCEGAPVDVGGYGGAGGSAGGISWFGVHDLAGNVAEWVYDAFSAYSTEPISNPLSYLGGTGVRRGGAFDDAELALRSAFRTPLAKTEAAGDLGFRCAAPQFDVDRDGVSDYGSAYCAAGEVFYCEDNCTTVPNPGQEDVDEAWPGDACADGEGEGCLDEPFGAEAEDLADDVLSLPANGLTIEVVTGASLGDLLVGNGERVGDQIVFFVDLSADFAGELVAAFAKRPDGAKVRLFLDSPLLPALAEAELGREPLNLHRIGAGGLYTARFRELEIKAGLHRLVVKVVGKSSLSNGYAVAVDRLEFVPDLTCGP